MTDLSRRQNYDPTPGGKVHPAPFLRLPFRSQDAHNSLVVDNGWEMAVDEIPIVGADPHRALDMVLAHTSDFGYGVPVLAAASGRAYFSYEYVTGAWKDPKTGVTHQLGYGAGLVVEIRHQVASGQPTDWVTQYAHLADVAQGIPYLQPEKSGEHDWSPSGLRKSNQELWDLGMPVVAGQVIGHQGDTGIGKDWWDDFRVETGEVVPRDRTRFKPWDPPQLHFQLYQGRVNGEKQNIIDPLDVYGRVHPKFNPYGKPGSICQGPQGVFLTDQHGRLQYAG